MSDSESAESDRQTYRTSRDQWRSKARYDLDACAPQFSQLLDDVDDFVAHLALGLSGQRIEALGSQGYINFLIVSFVRTHMTATDLARTGDLIDSAILVRKQMETLARLSELTSPTEASTAIRRTPNIGKLRSNLKQLYGAYSDCPFERSSACTAIGRVGCGSRTFASLSEVLRARHGVHRSHSDDDRGTFRLDFRES